MQVTLDLKESTADVVARLARDQGLKVDEFLRKVVEQVTGTGQEIRSLSLAEFDRDWDEFSRGTERLPILSDQDLSREAIYADHD